MINTKTGMENTLSNYRNNESETKTYYKDKVKIYYRNFKDIDLKITHNNTLPNWRLAKIPILEDIASMVEFNIM